MGKSAVSFEPLRPVPCAKLKCQIPDMWGRIGYSIRKVTVAFRELWSLSVLDQCMFLKCLFPFEIMKISPRYSSRFCIPGSAAGSRTNSSSGNHGIQSQCPLLVTMNDIFLLYSAGRSVRVTLKPGEVTAFHDRLERVWAPGLRMLFDGSIEPTVVVSLIWPESE